MASPVSRGHPIWASQSKDDSEVVGQNTVNFRRYGVKRVSTLKLLPSRTLSRLYGAVNNLTLPAAARPLVYGAWAWFFRVKLHEAERPAHEYKNLTAFFTRRLREGARAVDPRPHVMVSPVDGTVVSTSADMAMAGVLAQVKGIEYHITDFLGIPTPNVKPGNALFSAVLYLSPGDYHRFHSPTEWKATSRTHFAGQLLPVNPLVAYMLPSLFCANERVAVFGEWEHGFYSYTAVGATNVGSIRLAFDPSVITNTYRHDWACTFNPLEAAGAYGNTFRQSPRLIDAKNYENHIPLRRGDDIGLFELGSTVVLIFEAPLDFTFSVRAGDKVRLGQSIGRRTDPEVVNNSSMACFSPRAEATGTSSPKSDASTATVEEAIAYLDGGVCEEEGDGHEQHRHLQHHHHSITSTTTSSSPDSMMNSHLSPYMAVGAGTSKTVSVATTTVATIAAAVVAAAATSSSSSSSRRLSSESTSSSGNNTTTTTGRARANSAFAILEGSGLAAFEDSEAQTSAAAHVASCDPEVAIPSSHLRRLVLESSGRAGSGGGGSSSTGGQARRDRSSTSGNLGTTGASGAETSSVSAAAANAYSGIASDSSCTECIGAVHHLRHHNHNNRYERRRRSIASVFDDEYQDDFDDLHSCVSTDDDYLQDLSRSLTATAITGSAGAHHHNTVIATSRSRAGSSSNTANYKNYARSRAASEIPVAAATTTAETINVASVSSPVLPSSSGLSLADRFVGLATAAIKVDA